MANAFDSRLIEVDIQIGNEILTYNQGFFITAQGTKYGNQNPNECQVRIENLTQDHRNHILTQTSLFNPNKPVTLITLRAGRASYGLAQLFVGSVMTSGVTQPPDIGIIMNAVTNGAQQAQTVSVSLPGQTSLYNVAQKAASQIGLSLDFYATNKQITNYNFTGSVMDHIDKMADAGNVDVYIDDTSLVVKNKGQAIPGTIKEINLHTGMIGIPELTEQGVRVKYFYDNNSKIGQEINLTSQLNPALNGKYVIYNLHFDLASRDNDFYYVAECGRLPADQQ